MHKRTLFSRRNLAVRTLATALALAMAMPLELAAQSVEPKLPDPGTAGMNREQQEKLGAQVTAEVYKQMPVLPDSSPVTQYVQQLGRRLEKVIPPDRSWPYHFHVVPAQDINAFALPGGPIFVNLGTIQAAENEAQLAGVLAHEMSHIYMQHTAKSIPKQQWTALGAALAGIILPQSGVGTLARAGIQIGAGSVLMKYSRKDEAQADAVGAIIMYRAGYNPKAMADFFTALEKKYGSGGPQFLSDHPNPGNRQSAVQKEIAPWPPQNYVGSSSAFAAAKEKSAGIKTYSAQEIAQGAKSGQWAEQNKRNGAAPAGVQGASASEPSNAEQTPQSGGGGGKLANVSFNQIKPSANFAQLQQKNFAINYPDNWQTSGGEDSMIIGPQQGMGGGEIAYGVMIGSAPGSANALDQATKQLIQSIQQDNSSAKTTSEITPIEAGGTEGRSVYLSGVSPVEKDGKPAPERDWLVTIPNRMGGIMYLVFVAPEHEFNQLKPTYERMLNSLQIK
ncbi:MAG TPA: M48 family metallopeptidase [Candidatus Angelobacter sp.]